MAFRGITFSEQVNTAADFAHYQNTFLNGKSGKTKGCTVTALTNGVAISPGYFVVFGRWVCITATHSVYPGTTSKWNRLVFTVDLTKSNTTDDFRQGFFEWIASSNQTFSMTQHDLDAGGTIYQLPIADVHTNSLGNVDQIVERLQPLDINDVFTAMEAVTTGAQAQFDEWFNALEIRFEGSMTDAWERRLKAAESATSAASAKADAVDGRVTNLSNVLGTSTSGFIKKMVCAYQPNVGLSWWGLPAELMAVRLGLPSGTALNDKNTVLFVTGDEGTKGALYPVYDTSKQSWIVKSTDGLSTVSFSFILIYYA